MADAPGPSGQDTVDALLRQAQVSTSGAAAGNLGPKAGVPPQGAPAALGAGEIDALLKQSAGAPPMSAGAAAGFPLGNPPVAAGRAEQAGQVAQADIDFLLNQAEQALASIQSSGSGDPPPGAIPFRLSEFSGAAASTDNATLDLLRDVDLDLRIELGRTQMYLEDVLKLSKGAVVPLDKLAGDPVDIYANGRLIARGEVLILNDNFCVRVAELVAGETPPA
jgi:flagellar motor switch protein FliN/FliY